MPYISLCLPLRPAWPVRTEELSLDFATRTGCVCERERESIVLELNERTRERGEVACVCVCMARMWRCHVCLPMCMCMWLRSRAVAVAVHHSHLISSHLVSHTQYRGRPASGSTVGMQVECNNNQDMRSTHTPSNLYAALNPPRAPSPGYHRPSRRSVH
ncbi:uncharacterized protein K489DRAFT_89486 [Dissoconium aciculare CBS 342.82]|uniref:Uncharacterized protein n=1 Tax=Dissoconium aciculare CBS 342.82 TaxID=1314786 RepID=A0A6J3LVT8_9PEZI|nr:uncharacterized protein K489DRAFT_89486 [Dissoconium aciculare CBS 342.82]KAF1818742.1 hypothetical protein K489DRAFT_89486 [Dissoconium aciculare CBS 342.82]